MKLVIDINHPADFHLFKNLINQMKTRGHDILITASKKDVSFDLLNNNNMEYINVGTYGKGLVNKLINLPLIDLKMYKSVKSFNPDIIIGFGSIRGAHAAFLMGKKSINFTDTEHETEQIFLYKTFTSTLCTPSCYMKDLGLKQIRFNSYKELAYLHPNYFSPDPSVLDNLNLHEKDKFIILRLVSWDASHDIGHHGIKDKINFINKLENYGQVFISSESPLDDHLKKYKIDIAVEKMHDLLYYSSLYVGEGATMATEAAVLGVPSIFVSSLSGKLGYLNELEHNYGLVYSYLNEESALNRSIAILENNNSKYEWNLKKNKLLNEKIDINAFMIWFIENYPQSVKIMRNNPNFQNKFI